MNYLLARTSHNWLLWLLLSVFSSQLSVAAEPYSAQDLLRTKRVTSAEINPTGEWIAYTMESIRPAGDKAGSSYSELYLVSRLTKEIRPFVVGEERVTSIAWRPDGSAIAFISKRRENKDAQVWMIPLNGGEARQVTNLQNEVLGFRWSPDGKRLAYMATNAKSKREKVLEDAGYGFTYYEENLKHRNLYIMDVDANGKADTPEQLTADITVWSFDFAPDGKTIALSVSQKNLVDQDYMFKKIYILDLPTKALKQLTDNPGKLGGYAFSPDGKYLAYNAALSRSDHGTSQVLVIPTAGGEAKNLTIPNFRGHVTWVDWKDSKTVLYRAAEGVHSTLNTVQVTGGERKVILNSEKTGVVFDRISMTGELKQFACIGESPAIPGEVYYWTGGMTLERLTTANPWLTNTKLGKQEIIRYKARDGLGVEGLLIHPIDFAQGTKYPLIVVVHGGPESHYSNGWLSSYSSPGQVLAGKGYAVFYPNYRASTGYGVEFAAAGLGDPAGKEFDDIADGIDYLIKSGVADANRVGLGGGSYGGYASAWFATYYTKYVKAVCMFVGISDLISKAGTTDIPWEEVEVHAGKPVYEMWDLALKRSPIFYAGQSKTATLIMGGAADTRVYPSQSIELYRHMKLRGHSAVRLVQYPGEQHGNSKQPGRIDVLYRTLDWYDWYVKEAKPLDGPIPPLNISDRYGLELAKEEPTVR